jgi:hypothetical protein
VTTDADNGNWAETDVSSIEWSREAGKSSRGICKRLVELQHAAGGPARQLAQIQIRRGCPKLFGLTSLGRARRRLGEVSGAPFPRQTPLAGPGL